MISESRKEYIKAYREANKERITAYQKEYNKKYYQLNKEKRQEQIYNLFGLLKISKNVTKF